MSWKFSFWIESTRSLHVQALPRNKFSFSIGSFIILSSEVICDLYLFQGEHVVWLQKFNIGIRSKLFQIFFSVCMCVECITDHLKFASHIFIPMGLLLILFCDVVVAAAVQMHKFLRRIFIWMHNMDGEGDQTRVKMDKCIALNLLECGNAHYACSLHSRARKLCSFSSISYIIIQQLCVCVGARARSNATCPNGKLRSVCVYALALNFIYRANII